MSAATRLGALLPRLHRRGEQAFYDLRRRLGWFPRRAGSPSARLGVYVAYYDASWIFEDHLRAVRDLTVGPINYYVTANCTTPRERAWFDGVVSSHGFPISFHPWSKSPVLTHGESLQRMIEATDDEIIVLCDVDAFPLKAGWDDWVLRELETKDVVAAVVDMPERTMPVFLHPSFLAFRRSLLADNGLDVLPGEDHDPAYKITRHLLARGRMTRDHVSPLFPTRRAVEIYPAGTNRGFGRADLVHGFGTTYGDLVFHFWFGRHLARRDEPKGSDGRTLLSLEQMDRVVAETRGLLRGACEAASSARAAGAPKR